MENGTVWSNSSESSDDSSSPALAHQRLTASNALQTAPTTQLSLAPHKSSVSTPSLSSNQEEDESEGGDVFAQAEAVANGHLHTSCSDCAATDGTSAQSEDTSESSCPDRTAGAPALLVEGGDASATDTQDEPCEESSADNQQAEAEDNTAEAAEGDQEEPNKLYQSVQELKPEEAQTVS